VCIALTPSFAELKSTTTPLHTGWICETLTEKKKKEKKKIVTSA